MRQVWGYNLTIWGENHLATLNPELGQWSSSVIADEISKVGSAESLPQFQKVISAFPWRDHIFFLDSDGRFFPFNLRMWRFQTAGELNSNLLGNNYLSVVWKGEPAPTRVKLMFQLGQYIYMVDPEQKIYALDINGTGHFTAIQSIVPGIAGNKISDFFQAKGLTDPSMLAEVNNFAIAHSFKGGIRFLTVSASRSFLFRLKLEVLG